MEQRVYPGAIDPNELAQHLLDTWDQGDTIAQALEGDEGMIVQVGQRSAGLFSDEPQSALTLALEPVSEGLRVTLGEQQWYRDGGGKIMVGGLIGFFPFFFTWPLGGGHDEPVDPQLTGQVWVSVERYAQRYGAAPSQPPQQPAAATGATTRLPQQPGAATGATTRLPGVHCPSSAPRTRRERSAAESAEPTCRHGVARSVVCLIQQQPTSACAAAATSAARAASTASRSAPRVTDDPGCHI